MNTGIRKMRSFTLEKHRLEDFREGEEPRDDPAKESPSSSSCSLRQCRTLGELKRVHSRINVRGSPDPFLANLLIQKYGKCGSLQDAINAFRDIPRKNIFSWNLAMGACVHNSEPIQAIELLWEMDLEASDHPNSITFLTIIRACSLLKSRRRASAIADEIQNRCSGDVSVMNSLISLNSSWRRLSRIQNMFESLGRGRDVISWTALITANAQNGNPEQALKLFHQMDCRADRTTFVSVLGACSNLGGDQGLEEGRRIYKQLITSIECLESDSILCNSLMNMFGRCGSIEEARSVFETMKDSSKTVVSWNTLILAYSQSGNPPEAIKLFRAMDVKKNEVTFINALAACESLDEIEEIHREILENKLESGVLVGTSLIHSFGRLGDLERASSAFDSMKEKSKMSLVSWNSLLAAIASKGLIDQTEKLSCEMELEGVVANGVTILSLLHSCCHGGWVEKSRIYMREMEEHHGFKAGAEHFGCMVDVLGRVGELELAEELIFTMPFAEDAVSLMSLLCSCSAQGDLDRAIAAAERITLMEASACAPYSLLFNSFAHQFE